MRRLTLVYDASALPWFTNRWIAAEPKYVPIEVMSTNNAGLATRLPGIARASLDGRLTLVDDEGRVWRDGKAEIVTMWALRRFRARALAIGDPSRLPFRRGTLNWFAGGSGEPWPEAGAHGFVGAT